MRRVLGLTLGKAWDDDIFSHSAQAAFWQALSLPPLFLALLGSLGFVGGWFGPETVQLVDSTIIDFARRVFTADACYTRENMDRDILPTVVWDEREMSHALGRLRDLRDKQGATTVYGHDPAQWRTLPQAPAALA